MTSVWNIESLEVNPGNPTGVVLPKDLPGNTVVDLVAKPIIISPNWVWFTLTYGWNLLDMIGFNHIHWKPSILLLTSFPDFPWFMCPEGLNDFLPHASGTKYGWWLTTPMNTSRMRRWDPALKISFSGPSKRHLSYAGRARSPLLRQWWPRGERFLLQQSLRHDGLENRHLG